MAPDANYYATRESSPKYESYDGSGYGSALSSRTSSARYSGNGVVHGKSGFGNTQINGQYNGFDFRQSYDEHQLDRSHTSQPLANGVGGGGHFGDFKFHPDEPVISHQIVLDTKVKNHKPDDIGQHLLYETAMLDTQNYEILDMREVDDLKKEHARLIQRIEATNRKLALESKVKNAAANLQRLYSSSKQDGRPDTPQSNPESPRKHRNSLLGGRGRQGSGGQGAQTLHQAEDELAQSIKTVDDLQEQIKDLLNKRQTVERKLLQHTAAVLAVQASKSSEQRTDSHMNGHLSLDHDELHLPEASEFDGIRDILRGFPAPPSKHELQKAAEEQAQQLLKMQTRLEDLNSQLRSIINESSRTRGQNPAPEPPIEPSPDPKDRLEGTFVLLQSNISALEQEHEYSKAHHAQALETAQSTHSAASREMDEAQAKVQRANEYETVMAGLWELMAADSPSGGTARGSSGDDTNTSGNVSPVPPLKEDFSTQAFSSRVQHLLDRANGAKEQQDILRRQIQQQRDLNGKSDMEKDAQIDEIQAKYDELSATHKATEDELAKFMVSHEQSEREASESRNEMMNVMNELEQFKRTVDETQARQKEVDDRHAQISGERNEALQRQTELRQEMENLESEVVRLTTELTIAKADLEGAYGTRQERQKEAGMAGAEMDALNKLKDQEIADLKQGHEHQLETMRRELSDRSKLLESELKDMTNEFQEMTRESLELEKERGQLEGLIDGLRERCDTLEAQLNDEKVKWMGIKAPGGPQDAHGPRETTSVMVMRQEFKKMMRESRAEGVRLIRNEQEERRKLEAELRKVRQAGGPMERSTAAREALHASRPSQANVVPSAST